MLHLKEQEHSNLVIKKKLKKKVIRNLIIQKRAINTNNNTILMRKKVSKKLIDKINFKYKNMIHLNLSNVEWVVEECLILIV